MKLQRFYQAKDTVNRTKWHPTEWEKIFTNLTSDRGLIIKICEEFKKLNSNFGLKTKVVLRPPMLGLCPVRKTASPLAAWGCL